MSIKQAFENGLDADEIVAYHGTSLAVLELIIKTNELKGCEESDEFTRQGDVYVFPLSGKIREGLSINPYYPEEEALACAKVYAENNSFFHYFMNRLSTRVQSVVSAEVKRKNLLPGITDFIVSYVPKLERNHQLKTALTFYDFLVSHGYTPQEITKMYCEASDKKGVILGFDGTIFSDDYKPTPGDDKQDTRVLGIRVDQIIGIEPLDDEAYALLDKL